MLIRRAYKTKLITNNKQAAYLGKCARAARFVYNWALSDRNIRYDWQFISTNKYEQKRRFNSIKHEQYPWLSEVPYALVDQAFMNIDLAFQNFFRRVKNGETPGYPKFKSRYNRKQSFTLRGSIHVERDQICLPRIGWLRLAELDYIPTDGVKILSANISTDGRGWYVSVQVEETIPDPVSPDGNALGIDLGIKQMAVCSDGAMFDNPKALIVAQRKLARLEREKSRRTKRSNNWKKTVAKINRLHARIANIRRNAQHNVSRYVADQDAHAVVVEDLNVKGMVKNHCLARAVSDVGMGELRRQIEYKCDWKGIEVIKADRFFASSKTCSECGTKKEVLSLSEREFVCDECGVIIDRDLNAARNLAAVGNRQNGRGLPVELGCNNASL